MADLGSGGDVHGSPYANVWSGIGTALENNQAVAEFLGKIAQQVKVTAGNLVCVVTKANRVIT
jgi:hypothetical protein